MEMAQYQLKEKNKADTNGIHKELWRRFRFGSQGLCTVAITDSWLEQTKCSYALVRYHLLVTEYTEKSVGRRVASC